MGVGGLIAGLYLVSLVAAFIVLVCAVIVMGVKLIRRTRRLNATFAEIIRDQERTKRRLAVPITTPEGSR